jgi:lysophospholipase L1-like esterase
VTSGDGEETLATDDPSRPMTIWLAGDSTMANGNTPCPTGWGKHLGALFNEHTTVRNSAAGGRSVRTWMYNVTTEMGPDGECILQRDGQGNPTLQPRWQEMLDNMKSGDALLIQFGINDGSRTCDRHVGIAAFKQTYGVLAAAAKERGVQPVFITPVSSIACNGNVPRGTRGEFVDATLQVGAELGVPVLDLHARSVERYGELGFCPVPGGDVNAQTGGAVGEYFCDDHTHFSSSGAVDMAAVVVELMKKANLPFVSHLKAQP